MSNSLTIAVTGSTGFVGQHLLCRLRTAGHTIRALTRQDLDDDSDPNLVWVRGDLEDKESLAALMDGADVLVHVAGAIKAISRPAFFKVNRDGVRAVAAAAVQANVPRLVLISSIAAREPALSAYAASKRAGEMVLDDYQDRLGTVILRPPAIYGPGDMETASLFKMATNGFVVFPANRDSTVSLIHVGDVVTAIQACCEYEQSGQPLEIDDGTPGGHRWPDIAAAAGEAVGRSPRIIHLPDILLWLGGAMGTLKGLLTRRPAMLTLSKVPELLHPDWLARGPVPTGWSPSIPLKEGFEDATDWYSSQNVLNRYL